MRNEGLDVKKGQFVELVRYNKQITKLTFRNRYEVLSPSGMGKGPDRLPIRLYLRCDDGEVRSFNYCWFKVCEEKTDGK